MHGYNKILDNDVESAMWEERPKVQFVLAARLLILHASIIKQASVLITLILTAFSSLSVRARELECARVRRDKERTWAYI